MSDGNERFEIIYWLAPIVFGPVALSRALASRTKRERKYKSASGIQLGASAERARVSQTSILL